MAENNRAFKLRKEKEMVERLSSKRKETYAGQLSGAEMSMALINVLAFLAVRDIEEGDRCCKMLLGREPDTQPYEGVG